MRAFIAERLPAHIKRKVEDGLQLMKEDDVSRQKILYERGWMAPNWPKQYGGTGWTPIERYLVRRLRIIPPAILFSCQRIEQRLRSF